MIEVDDDTGRRVVLTQEARRIVSLVPSLTETLFAFGAGPAVVGATRYCSEPAVMPEHVQRVGGTKNPHVGGIVALQPDLVLMNAEENRKEDFDALERSGLTVFVCLPRRARDTADLLRRLAQLTGASGAAQAMVDELQEALRAADQFPAATRHRVFCPIWKNPWMSFNHDTYADDMLSLAGGVNVCRQRSERYCLINLDDVAAAQPEIVLLPDEPYVFSSKDLAALVPLRETPAWQNDRIHFIDGKSLSWYGPRTAPAVRYLRALVHRSDAVGGNS